MSALHARHTLRESALKPGLWAFAVLSLGSGRTTGCELPRPLCGLGRVARVGRLPSEAGPITQFPTSHSRTRPSPQGRENPIPGGESWMPVAGWVHRGTGSGKARGLSLELERLRLNSWTLDVNCLPQLPHLKKKNFFLEGDKSPSPQITRSKCT